MPAEHARNVSRTLDLHEVLEDECAALYPGSGVAPARLDDPGGYQFSLEQILDVPTLSRLLRESGVVIVNPSAARVAIAAIADGQEGLLAEAAAVCDRRQAGTAIDPASFTKLLVARLNALVSGNLVTDVRFRDLRTRAGVVDADVADARRPRANRLLLEAALAPTVARVRDVRLAALRARMRPYMPTALCLSGGGIRSCSFALGVVTGLARHGLLGKFDYLSTVSGGGYLGGWLSGWMAHQGAGTVQRSLAGHSGTTLDPEPDAVRYLRSYSAFLTPRLGLFTADTWTLIGTLIRNLLLNWLVILPLLAGAVMLPRVAVAVLRSREQLAAPAVPGVVPIVFAIAAFVLGTRALVYVYRNRPVGLPSEAERDQRSFLLHCLIPLLGAALTFSYAWWLFGPELTASAPAWAWLGAAMAMNLTGWVIGSRGRGGRAAGAVVVAASSATSGLLAPVMLDALSRLADRPALQAALTLPPHLLRPRLFLTLAVPVFMLLIMIGGKLFVGLTSTRSSNADREWNARFNAWLLIVTLGWAGVCGIVLFLPPLFEDGWRDPRLMGLHAIGMLSGVIGALLGASPTTPATAAAARAAAGANGVAATGKRVLLALAAPVFAISLIAVISVFDAALLGRLCDAMPAQCRAATAASADLALSLRHAGDYDAPLVVLLTALGLMAGGWGLGRLIDTNQFSLHAMYRSRLVRTFLGASRPQAARAPDPFTGFDERDDFPIGALWPPSLANDVRRDRDETMPPLHVVNVTLNVVEGRSRAWQQRKAESMTVSSLHAGAPFLGHRRTRLQVEDGLHHAYGGPAGISLGNAITISGAAASPEAGYNSSPAISFLMALFNGRLGWWLGNPGAQGDRTFGRSGPRVGITPLLSEMFGLTTDRSSYVFLSDGGHFDNLGLYAMVLRRCRCIVVSDAGCDPDQTFDDLGNAIRKIRIDLGVSIEFPTDQPPFGRTTATDATAFTGWAVGRIRYSQVDRPEGDRGSDDEYDGVLIYVKPTLCGGEPVDVVNYARRNATFPHESTMNQFFTESQFESYRSLGLFETERMCQALGLGTADAAGVPALNREPMRWLERQRKAATAEWPQPSGVPAAV